MLLFVCCCGLAIATGAPIDAVGKIERVAVGKADCLCGITKLIPLFRTACCLIGGDD